jgi:hypothetical protein
MSVSEKGHAKNVANLSKLIKVCQGFGAKYNPTKTAIKVANLQIKFNTTTTQLQDIKDGVVANKTAINNRKVGFKGFNKYSTRILGSLKATDASTETIENAISINKKIQGERIAAAKKQHQQKERQHHQMIIQFQHHNNLSSILLTISKN